MGAVLQKFRIDRSCLKIGSCAFSMEQFLHRIFENIHAIRGAPSLQDYIQTRRFDLAHFLENMMICLVFFVPILINIFLLKDNVHSRSVKNIVEIDSHEISECSWVLFTIVEYFNSAWIFKNSFQQGLNAEVQFLISHFFQ